MSNAKQPTKDQIPVESENLSSATRIHEIWLMPNSQGPALEHNESLVSLPFLLTVLCGHLIYDILLLYNM